MKPNSRNTGSFNILSDFLGIAIGLLFIVLGIAILTAYIQMPGGNDTTVKVFAAMMTIYGVYRLFRVYLKKKATNKS